MTHTATGLATEAWRIIALVIGTALLAGHMARQWKGRNRS